VAADPTETAARVARMRRSYEQGGLDEAALAPTWLDQLARWLADAEAAGLVEPNAMVLATADAAGRPSARTVLLKGLDERGLVLFTNLGSRKGREARATAHGAIVLPWIALQRQVVVRGGLEEVAGEEADAYFASRPHGSQLGALASPQGRVIASRAVLDERRAALEAQFPPGTAVPRPADWGGLRLVPETVEFWQGRPDRLHDRLHFRRAGGTDWVVERLAP
jgi:pyridoxamine 5'-phosphate oxidase